ncbi:MAG: transketolase [Pseudomonadota bacterium]|jgi:transketolase
MKSAHSDLAALALTVRMLSLDGVEKANSGHPGLPLGAADFTSVLWADFLEFNPQDPSWANRDRFILSAGHGSMLWYSLLHLFGYDLPMEEIKSFRQWGSKTPGHPEFGMTPGIETTTGPLGQGFGNGVGMALSGKLLAAEYGADLFNFRVFGLVSDGDLMEGISAEAASLAGHLGLNNLIYLYDDNKISLAGETEVTFTESVQKRFEAYNWFVQSCDGHDMAAVSACIEKATQEQNRPSIICCRTLLGFGSPNKANTHDAHGAPLGAEEVKLTKQNLGWPTDAQFLIPDGVKGFISSLVKTKASRYSEWQKKFSELKTKDPIKAKRLEAHLKRELPPSLQSELLAAFKDSKKDATRNLSGKAIQVIAKQVPWFIGGSADLEPSTKTSIKEGGEIQAKEFGGRNIRFGVREHAMGAAVNGLAYSQCWIPFSATFLVFSDYMRPSIRLAALSHLQSIFIFTHDSFWVGEDGPTHEPIEHIAALRAIPNLYVWRPADGIEVAMSYQMALEMKHRPSTLLFTRQNLPPLDRPTSFKPDEIRRGAYTVVDSPNPEIVITATGSEVWLAVEAAKTLSAEGRRVRVVSIPCLELFREQDTAFQLDLLPPKAKKVSIEAGITLGWERVVGTEGLTIGIDHYGASAPGELLAQKFGFTPGAVTERVKAWLAA